MIGTVPTSIGIGLIFAIFANKALKFRGFVRTSFFYPNVVPMIALANIWLFIYTPEYGLLSRLTNFLHMGNVSWLGSETWVMTALTIMMIWKEAGYFMIFYLAGIQNISPEIYEAAKIDGIHPFKVFWRITFPLLMPTTLFVLIVALTNSFKTVDQLFVMTQGGFQQFKQFTPVLYLSASIRILGLRNGCSGNGNYDTYHVSNDYTAVFRNG